MTNTVKLLMKQQCILVCWLEMKIQLVPGQGSSRLLKKELRKAILSELQTYITLENAGQVGIPNTLKLSKILALVLKPHSSQNTNKQMQPFFTRMIRDDSITSNINNSTKNSKMRRDL